MNSTIYTNKRKTYYLNGNYLVFYSYGEKIYKRALRIGEDFIADFPDSIDLKITNKCSNNCPYCHENSISSGNNFNFDHTIEILKQLPKVPIEIAIGGGNVLEIPGNTLNLINWCNGYGFKTRMTINQKDVEKFNLKVPIDKKIREYQMNFNEVIFQNISNNIGGVGISLDPDLLDFGDIQPNMWDYFKFSDLVYGEKSDSEFRITNGLKDRNVVYHIIAGLFPIDKLKKMLNKDWVKGVHNLLILGYKQFGRAANTELPESLPEFENVVKEFITKSRNDYTYDINLAFDNLALEQLHIKEFITDDDWDSLYLGEEGSCSMYIDAVNETYARSSTSINRVSWKDISLLEFFKSLRDESNN